MTNRKLGVYDLVPINGSVMIGNGKSISCTHRGKMDVICKHKDGSLARETWEVKIVPELNHDLFSFTKAMKDGWQMNGRWKEGGLMIELFKTGRASMKFDRMIPSGSSWLMGIKVHRVYDKAHAAMEAGKSISATKLHNMTGHTGEHLLKPTANYMKLKLIGRLPPCEVCAKAKIRQRNVQKKRIKKMPTKPGYRVFIDISSFKQVSRGGNKHWLFMVDEFSDYTHSLFLKKQSDQIKILPMWIKGIAKKHRIEIKRIRLDNSGENKSLQKECDKQNLGIIFEFTAPGTPQQNSVAERRIPTLMGIARAMLIQAGLEEEFWCEVISTATKLDNIMVRPERTKPPHTLFYGEDAKYARSLRTFGEMAVVAIHEGKKMRSKLDNRGKTCMFVGYADDHTKDVYRFLNIQIIGKKEQIDDFASKIQKVFSVKIQHNLADYLGCEFYMNKERTRGWLGQPSIIKSLEQKFGERAMKERLSLTPGTPRFTARRIEDPEDKVNPQDHEIYRSGVGTLLYLTKHSRPDICNPVRELSKTMDAPAPAHLKEMYKLIRHVLATKGYGLKFELRKDIIKWALNALSDSDFASDKETRISVFGYIIYFCGIPIAWRSKGMKSVVLSTTEAEYMALSEVVKELKFIVQLLQTMNIEVELPITVHVDNVGAIWLSNNRTTSDRTKHIDIRTSFVNEYQEDGKIIIKFVKSEENEADIFTKNTTNVIFNHHQKKLVWDKTNVDNEVSQEPDQSENQQEGC